MADAAQEPGGWDARTEATRAFGPTGSVRAVIFCSNVAVIKKAERGPSRRQQDKLLRKLKGLARDGKHDEARTVINQTSWRGPQTVWWTSSISELADMIDNHYQIIRQRKIADGVSVEKFTGDVVLFQVWWDQ